MTLNAIVKRRGGDIWSGGGQALIPAPGHSAKDRSVSLRIGDTGKVIANTFGGGTWREVLDSLRRDNLIDEAGFPVGGLSSGRVQTPSVSSVSKSAPQRIAAAVRHWIDGVDVGERTPGARYLRLRGIIRPLPSATVLRYNRVTPLAAYRPGCSTGAAVVWAITDSAGEFSGVEVTFLTPEGRRSTRMRLSRKTVGLLPKGAAIRLDQSCAEMLVAEGVPTTLSATERFELPGWALGSVNNLRSWAPPEGVRSVLIAGDNGAPGREGANHLARVLRSKGVAARVEFPDVRFKDWNDAAADQAGTGEGRASTLDVHRPLTG